MNGVLMLGRRSDGRPVFLIGGGAGDPAATGDPASAPADPSTAGTGDGGEAGAGDGAEEVEFTEEAFKKIVDDLNRERAEREKDKAAWEAEKAEAQRKLHAASQKAATYRLRAKGLTEMLAQEESAAKPEPKSGANGSAAAGTEPAANPEVTRLAAELKATQMRMLTSEAHAALLRAEVNPKHVERLARMLDLNPDGRDDVPSIGDQIGELKAEMPELFIAAAPAAQAPSPAASGGRVLRAPLAVAGKGAAGRGGGAPQPLKSEEILANRALGRDDDYRG
jgi:hypothetical protein